MNELIITMVEGAPNFAALIAFVVYLARRDEREAVAEERRESWYQDILNRVIEDHDAKK